MKKDWIIINNYVCTAMIDKQETQLEFLRQK